MITWFLFLLVLVLLVFVIFLLSVIVNGSQDDNQAVSLNMRADEPTLKDPQEKSKNKGAQ